MSDTLGEEVTIYREEYDRLVAAARERDELRAQLRRIEAARGDGLCRCQMHLEPHETSHPQCLYRGPF